jgi:hypothetical protein
MCSQTHLHHIFPTTFLRYVGFGISNALHPIHVSLVCVGGGDEGKRRQQHRSTVHMMWVSTQKTEMQQYQ